MKNVYQIGSGNLTFEIIERIINENLKLEFMLKSNGGSMMSWSRPRPSTSFCAR